LRLNRIEAATLEENIASKNLLKKIGFKKEGVLRKYLKINGTWRDHILYGLLENDFK
jgi:ribosomal-protein-alanine N-acetyltransferase